MLVVMKAQATQEEIQAVCDHIEQLGFRPHPLPGAQRTAIGITGNQGEVNRGNLESLSGVAEVIRISSPYKLAGRSFRPEGTIVRYDLLGVSALANADIPQIFSTCNERPRKATKKIPINPRAGSTTEVRDHAGICVQSLNRSGSSTRKA